MNIVLRELKANLKGLIIWSVSIFFIIYVGMVKYSGLEAAGQSAKALFDQLPPALKDILGMQGLDLTSISGYYAIFSLYFMLLAGIHAVMLGAIIISKEERDKTADFLFVKPVVRSKIITSKLVAVFINIVLLNVVILVSSIYLVKMFNKGEPIDNQIINLMLAIFIFQVVFASIGAGISALAQNTKKATSLATTVLLSTFMLSVAIDLYDKIDFLKYLTPFKYFNTIRVMRERAFNLVFLLLSAAIIIGCTSLTYILYKKRDIKT